MSIESNLRTYGKIAGGIGATITGINLLRGFYTKYKRNEYRTYPSRMILEDSFKKGIIFGGLWPVTGIMTLGNFVSNMVEIGLNPSMEILNPMNKWYSMRTCFCEGTHRNCILKDNNETSEEPEENEKQVSESEIESL